MSHAERLAIVVSLLLLGFVVLILVPLPSRELTFTVLGSALGLRITGATGLAFLLVVTVCAGSEELWRLRPAAPRRPWAYRVTFWPLPALSSILGVLLVGGSPTQRQQIVLASLTIVGVTSMMALQVQQVAGGGRRGRTLLHIATYFVALLYYGLLLGARLRSILSATGVLLVSATLSLELLRHPQQVGRTWLYAVILGLLMGELTWALNYTSVSGQVGAGLLLLIYYVLSGLVQQYLWARLSRRVVLEFAVVFAAWLALLLFLAVRV